MNQNKYTIKYFYKLGLNGKIFCAIKLNSKTNFMSMFFKTSTKKKILKR